MTEPTSGGIGPGADLDLTAAVMEIEAHVADGGWDQPARLFALVDTVALVAREPALASAMGLTGAADEGALTAVEQDGLTPGLALEQMLETIVWPSGVSGCAAVVERLVLPPEVDDDLPADSAEATEFAATHPLRQEVRIVAGATRAGATYCAMRLRAHDHAVSVVGGPDLVPALLELLSSTLTEESF